MSEGEERIVPSSTVTGSVVTERPCGRLSLVRRPAKFFLPRSLPLALKYYIYLVMASFQEDRQRIAKDLAQSQAEEMRLLEEVGRMTAELTRVRARIASLKAADQTFASAVAGSPAPRGNVDLSRMTIREAILTVLTEAKPEPVRTRDLDRILTERGKKVQGGVSVDLTTLKQADKVLNPRWGFWTVP
jgi:hypothetical protein